MANEVPAKQKPHANWILVKVEEDKKETFYQVRVPDSYKNKVLIGKIIAVGAGEEKEDGSLYKMPYKKGDRLILPTRVGQELSIKGEKHLYINLNQVYAKVL